MNRHLGLLLLLLLIAPAFTSHAQDRPPTLADLRAAYEALQFDRVVRLGEAITESPTTNDTDRLDAHRLLALVGFSRQQASYARLHLERALEIEPSMEFDISEASPSFIDFFAEVKKGYLARAATNSVEGDSDEREPVVYLSDVKPAAALRSMVVPGWGQIYKGQRLRGVAYGALWTGLTAASVVSMVQRADARTRYEEERDINMIEARYEDYASWHRRRNVALGAAGAVWLASFVDALLTESRPPRSNVPRLSPQFAGPVGSTGLSVHIPINR